MVGFFQVFFEIHQTITSSLKVLGFIWVSIIGRFFTIDLGNTFIENLIEIKEVAVRHDGFRLKWLDHRFMKGIKTNPTSRKTF